MKNIIGIFVVIAAWAFVSCDPVEKRMEFDKDLSPITDAEISQYVKIEQQIREGKKSNYFKFTSEGLKALTAFQHGLGKAIGTGSNGQFIQCFVVPGVQDITLLVKNADGSEIQKKYTFTIEECFDVAPQWALFCGSGSKAWTWKESLGSNCYGMGDVFGDVPNWWCPAPGERVAGEGFGATMTFSASGSSLTKTRTNGTTESGTFGFDMTKQHIGYGRSIGQLSTNGTSVLAGTSTKDARVVTLYEILTLNEKELMLCVIDMDEPYEPDSQGWGQATLWVFEAK